MIVTKAMIDLGILRKISKSPHQLTKVNRNSFCFDALSPFLKVYIQFEGRSINVNRIFEKISHGGDICPGPDFHSFQVSKLSDRFAWCVMP